MKEAMEKQDGLPLKNLETGFAGEIFLKATRPWWVMNLINRIGLGRMVALHSYQAILNASAAALLTVRGMEPEDFLKGGSGLRTCMACNHPTRTLYAAHDGYYVVLPQMAI